MLHPSPSSLTPPRAASLLETPATFARFLSTEYHISPTLAPEVRKFNELKEMATDGQTHIAAIWVLDHVASGIPFFQVPPMHLELDASVADVQLFDHFITACKLVYVYFGPCSGFSEHNAPSPFRADVRALEALGNHNPEATRDSRSGRERELRYLDVGDAKGKIWTFSELRSGFVCRHRSFQRVVTARLSSILERQEILSSLGWPEEGSLGTSARPYNGQDIRKAYKRRHMPHIVYSMLEMMTVIPEVVKRVDFEFEYPGREMKTENVWFVKPRDLRCRIWNRVA